MSRLDVIGTAAMSERQREVSAAISGGRRGQLHGRDIGLSGPFNAWIRSPELAARAEQLGAFLRFETRLPARLSELAIIVVGRHMNAAFEFAAHAPLALDAGLAPAIVDAIRHDAVPGFDNADEACVYAFTRMLLREHQVDDATYAAACAAFGEAGVVELVALIGYYGLVSLTLNTFKVPLRPGMQNPFA